METSCLENEKESRREYLLSKIREYRIRKLEVIFPDIREAIENGETRLAGGFLTDEELEKSYQEMLKEN